MTGTPEIRIAPDSRTWAAMAAELVQTIGQQSLDAKGRFLIALSGGKTPASLYTALTSSVYAGRFDWSRTTFFFSDERCVPSNDMQSNYAVANQALFGPLNIAPAQVYRMAGESRDLQEAAREYERQLRNVTKTAAPDQPQIDLVLLGLGEDGHVASLFPGTASLQDRRSVIIVTHSPKDPPVRLSMTLGVINRASVVLFLVVGAGKAGVVRGVLDPKSQVERHLPAALVAPDHGRLIWLLDPAAAAALR